MLFEMKKSIGRRHLILGVAFLLVWGILLPCLLVLVYWDTNLKAGYEDQSDVAASKISETNAAVDYYEYGFSDIYIINELLEVGKARSVSSVLTIAVVGGLTLGGYVLTRIGFEKNVFVRYSLCGGMCPCFIFKDFYALEIGHAVILYPVLYVVWILLIFLCCMLGLYMHASWHTKMHTRNAHKKLRVWIVIKEGMCYNFSVSEKCSVGVNGKNVDYIEVVLMGYAGDHVIEFHGETFKALCSNRESYVSVNGVRHDILPNTLSKFKNCSNASEYIESIESFAYSVLIEKSIPNDEYFAE